VVELAFILLVDVKMDTLVMKFQVAAVSRSIMRLADSLAVIRMVAKLDTFVRFLMVLESMQRIPTGAPNQLSTTFVFKVSVDCEDCRSIDVSLIKMAHFMLCQKPWHWLPSDDDRIQEQLCRKLHHEWFRVRKDLEDFLIAPKKQCRSVAKFLLPTFYIAIIRCLGVLEGLAIEVDPKA